MRTYQAQVEQNQVIPAAVRNFVDQTLPARLQLRGAHTM